MKGEDLRRAVKASGIKLVNLSKKTNIAERTISGLYLEENIPEDSHYLKKIAEAGVDLQKTAPGMSVELLQQLSDTQKEYIKDLKKTIISQEKQLAAQEKTIATLQDVIEKGFEKMGKRAAGRG